MYISVLSLNGGNVKKLLALITGLVAGSALYALPVLNPAAPALLTDGVFKCDEGNCWGIKFGYRGDFVYNKHMRDELTHVRNFALFANEGVLTLNLWDRLDIYGFVGAAHIDIDTVGSDLFLATARDYFIAHTNTSTIGGVGIKAILWEACWGSCGTTYIGIDAQYEWLASAKIDRATINGTNVATNGASRKYKEGQAALGISHKISNFLPVDLVPYVAVKYSGARSNFGGPVVGTLVPTAVGQAVNQADYRSQRHWGYAIGASLVDAGRMSVTAEARFIDETALTVAADIRF